MADKKQKLEETVKDMEAPIKVVSFQEPNNGVEVFAIAESDSGFIYHELLGYPTLFVSEEVANEKLFEIAEKWAVKIKEEVENRTDEDGVKIRQGRWPLNERKLYLRLNHMFERKNQEAETKNRAMEMLVEKIPALQGLSLEEIEEKLGNMQNLVNPVEEEKVVEEEVVEEVKETGRRGRSRSKTATSE